MKTNIPKFRKDCNKHFYGTITTEELIESFVKNVIKPFCDANNVGYETGLKIPGHVFLNDRGIEMGGLRVPKEIRDAIRELHSITCCSYWPQERYYPWAKE